MMGEQFKETIDSTLFKEKLQHLSVDITLDDSSSLDGAFQCEQSTIEGNLPSPKNSANFSQRNTPMVRHHELTPVTRNVSYIDTYPFANEVSPDDDRLAPALPDQIHSSSSNDGSASGIPLKIRNLPSFPTIQSGDRSKSLRNTKSRRHGDEEDDNLWQPIIQIPSRETFDSFSSLQHLVKQINKDHTFEGSRNHTFEGSREGDVLTPYQPSRHDLINVEAMHSNDLSSILIQKDRKPITIGDRQLSIPSIHMSNAWGGSIATMETDEDDLLKDDESWSTRESSSLNLSEDSIDPSLFPGMRFTPTKQQPLVIVEGGELLLDGLPPLGGNVSSHAVKNNNISSSDKENKQRSRSAKDQAAYEWLRTMEGGSAFIAEAASSKFLTRETRNLARQKSSPSEIN